MYLLTLEAIFYKLARTNTEIKINNLVLILRMNHKIGIQNRI